MSDVDKSSKQKCLREAAQALADRMPKGADALNSFHARREVIELRRALEHSADETTTEQTVIVYKNGTYKKVPSASAWEYQNDPDWLVTIPACERLPHHEPP